MGQVRICNTLRDYIWNEVMRWTSNQSNDKFSYLIGFFFSVNLDFKRDSMIFVFLDCNMVSLICLVHPCMHFHANSSAVYHFFLILVFWRIVIQLFNLFCKPRVAGFTSGVPPHLHKRGKLFYFLFFFLQFFFYFILL